MKARLQATLGQHLAMTPQLQQAIRLLQLPVADLATELAEAVASNPLLEWAGESSTPQTADKADSTEIQPSPDQDASLADLTAYDSRSGGRDEPADDLDAASLTSDAEDLQQHLRWQLHLRRLSETDRAIGAALIDAIDPDGYLRSPLDEIASTLQPEHDVDGDQVLAVLRLIQDMDPVGVGARDLAECLQLQLRSFTDHTPALEIARQLASEHLSQLPRQGAEGLARQLRADLDLVQAAIALLRSLNPRPGNQFAVVDEADHVLPDVIIWRAGGQWRARLGAHAGPPVTINQHYASLIGQCSGEDAGYLRAQLQQARWLIKGLQARGQTLLRVAQSLVRHQSGYLEFGDQALQPLTLREMAAELELHESTISRAIAGKFVHTPRGTVPMRHFFSQAVVGEDGSESSGTAIQAMIRRLIEDENPRKPLSDAKLMQLLQTSGVTVARRTVAKYREAMSIPPSHERVRMG